MRQNAAIFLLIGGALAWYASRQESAPAAGGPVSLSNIGGILNEDKTAEQLKKIVEQFSDEYGGQLAFMSPDFALTVEEGQPNKLQTEALNAMWTLATQQGRQAMESGLYNNPYAQTLWDYFFRSQNKETVTLNPSTFSASSDSFYDWLNNPIAIRL